MEQERDRRLRVLVADNDEQLRAALVRFLGDTFEIVGAAATGRQLVDAALAVRPDVIVCDLAMPVLNGPAAVQALRNAANVPPFVLLTDGVRNVREWIQIGILGVVHKDDLEHELVQAIRAAGAGQVYLSRGAFGK